MKKYIVLLLSAVICSSTLNFAYAKSTSDPALASAIRLYKAGNYSQCHTALSNIVKKDPSNAVAYYYLAITSAQIGKRDEAISNYDKVLSLSPSGQLSRYAQKGKVCLENPDKCHEMDKTDADTALDIFVQQKFGSGFSDEARSDYEKHKIENMMREMNRGKDIAPQQFKEYKDFSSYNSDSTPTNEEIVAALRVLQKAGFSDLINNGYSSDISLLSGNQNNNAMLNMLLGNNGNSSLSPQVIQSLLTNQLSTGF